MACTILPTTFSTRSFEKSTIRIPLFLVGIDLMHGLLYLLKYRSPCLMIFPMKVIDISHTHFSFSSLALSNFVLVQLKAFDI